MRIIFSFPFQRLTHQTKSHPQSTQSSIGPDILLFASPSAPGSDQNSPQGTAASTPPFLFARHDVITLLRASISVGVIDVPVLTQKKLRRVQTF
jgi:hypothetical protein